MTRTLLFRIRRFQVMSCDVQVQGLLEKFKDKQKKYWGVLYPLRGLIGHGHF